MRQIIITEDDHDQVSATFVNTRTYQEFAGLCEAGKVAFLQHCAKQRAVQAAEAAARHARS